MTSVNNHLDLGRVWSIKHACNNNEALLVNAYDRRRWLYWLFQARRRFGLSILNYAVLDNEIRLLVLDQGRGEIPCSMQLVAGRFAQEYNRRNQRSGPFWAGRYQSTQLTSNTHLPAHLIDMDICVVLAGLAAHPQSWRECGFYELQNPPERARRINFSALQRLLNPLDLLQLQYQRRQWIQDALASESLLVAGLTGPRAIHSGATIERSIQTTNTTMRPASPTPVYHLVPKRLGR